MIRELLRRVIHTACLCILIILALPSRVSCSDLTDKHHIQTLLEHELVDPWGLDGERRLHVRLGDQLWSELQHTFPECSVAIENVEEYVQKAEEEMFNTTRLGAADWFDEYVRCCF